MIDEHKYRIFFSTKWYKIRINQQTILDMGYPTMVRMLISPEKKELVVQPCNSYEKLSFKVPNDFGEDSHGFELSSIALTELLVDTMGWDMDTHYRVYGRYIKKENIVVFDLKKFKVVLNDDND